jgi:GNAT superfamily N-acetyltransferase
MVSSVGTLVLERVASRAQVREWQAVADTIQRVDLVDLPCDPPQDFYPLVESRAVDELHEFWLGRVGAATVAVGTLRAALLDNLDTATLDLQVLPAHRRRGYGSTMLAQLTGRCAELGRSTIFVETQGPLGGAGPTSPGELFLSSTGARAVTDELRSRLVIADVDVAGLTTRIESLDDVTCGYWIRSWADGSPADLADDLARLAAGMSTDAPLGDMAWEPENWTPDRYLRAERMSQERGRRRVSSAVIEGKSGRAVGVSVFGLNTFTPDVVRQGETIVVAEHRGHRLGMLLKLVNLRQLIALEPFARVVITWNAVENTHMRAINDELGFTAVDRWGEWQLAALPGPG